MLKIEYGSSNNVKVIESQFELHPPNVRTQVMTPVPGDLVRYVHEHVSIGIVIGTDLNCSQGSVVVWISSLGRLHWTNSRSIERCP